MHELIELLYFTTTWCVPCKFYGPVLDRLIMEYPKNFVLRKIDTEKEPELAKEYEINSVPTVIARKKDGILSVILGARTYTELVKSLEHLIHDGN